MNARNKTTIEPTKEQAVEITHQKADGAASTKGISSLMRTAIISRTMRSPGRIPLPRAAVGRVGEFHDK